MVRAAFVFILFQLALTAAPVAAQSSHAPLAYQPLCIDAKYWNHYTRSHYTDPKLFAQLIADSSMERPASCTDGSVDGEQFIASLKYNFEHAHRLLAQYGFSPLRDAIRTTARLGPDNELLNVLYVQRGRPGLLAASSVCDKGDDVVFIQAGTDAYALVRKQPQVNPAVFLAYASHELHHLVQNSILGKQMNCGGDKPLPAWKRRQRGWWIEGTADAYGIFAAREAYRRDHFGPYGNGFYKRFFLSRPYYVPLNYASESIETSGAATHLLDYRSNGFWMHVLERYMDGQPKQFEALYRALAPSLAGQTGNPTQAIDDYLDTLDGAPGKGLQTAFPQFLSEYVSWPRHRFGRMRSMSAHLALSFRGCEKFALSTDGPSALSKTLQLAPLAGACVDIEIERVGQPLSVAIVAGGDSVASVDDLYLGWGETLIDDKPHRDCHAEVTKNPARKPYCLLDPRQGALPANASVAARGHQAVRSWWIPDSEIPGSPGAPRKVTLRLILSRVADQVADYGNYDKLPRAIPLSIALDHARVNVPRAAAPAHTAKPGPAGPSPAARERRAAIPSVGVTASGNFSPLLFDGPINLGAGPDTLNAALTGRLDLDQILNRPELAGVLSAGIGLTLLSENPGTIDVDADTLPTLSLILADRLRNGLVPGETGSFDVVAMATLDPDDESSTLIQDPKRPSRLTIHEHTFESMRFSGQANLCRIVFSSVTDNPCREKVMAEFSGSISFPSIRMRQQPWRVADTPALKGYQGLRLAALFGPAGDGGGALMPADTSAGPKGSGGRINGAPSACDCSCAGLKRMETLDDATAQASAQQLSTCAMQCMGAWMQCE